MTAYISLKLLRFADLFDGRLDRFGVTESIRKRTPDESRCLTDGNSFVWVYPDSKGFAEFYTDFRFGSPERILSSVEEVFETKIVSEYEPQYWGFETLEEWDRWEAKISAKEDAEWYEDVMKYLRGEPHDIMPGTLGARWADRAKELIANRPELALPANKAQLLKEAKADTGEIIQVSEEGLATARMLATHEDDLPKA